MIKPLISVAAALTLAVALHAAEKPPSPALALRFADRQITVSSVPGRHQVILVGVGIGSYANTALLTRYGQAATDDDGDGEIAYRVPHLPLRSVWVAIDYETGEYTVAGPTGVLPAALTIPGEGWRAGVAPLDVQGDYLEGFVVRPRVGAWTLRMADGGSNDSDGKANGAIRLRLDRMRPIVGGDSGPPVVTGKDLIVLVNPHNLQFVVKEAH